MAGENQMGQGPAIPPQVEKEADRVGKQARKAAEEVGSVARHAWDDVQDRVRTFREDTDHYVRQNPTKAVFTALGIGFTLGLIFQRR